MGRIDVGIPVTGWEYRWLDREGKVEKRTESLSNGCDRSLNIEPSFDQLIIELVLIRSFVDDGLFEGVVGYHESGQEDVIELLRDR